MTTQLQNLNTLLCAGKGQSVLRLATGSTVWATSVLLPFDTWFKHLYCTNVQRPDGVERRVAFLCLAGSLQSAIACTHIRAHSLTHSLTHSQCRDKAVSLSGCLKILPCNYTDITNISKYCAVVLTFHGHKSSPNRARGWRGGVAGCSPSRSIVYPENTDRVQGRSSTARFNYENFLLHKQVQCPLIFSDFNET